MKKRIVAGLAVVFFSGVQAETVTNNLDVQGGFVYNHGVINPGDAGLTFTNSGVRDVTVSAGQLSGVDPETGTVITNAANLLSLKAQSLTAVSNITAGGSFIGSGAGLSNLNASALTAGTINAGRLPTSGTWNASGLTVSNLTASIAGNVAAMTNLTFGSNTVADILNNLQQKVAAISNATKYSVTAQVTDNEVTNGLNLIAAYAQAKTMNPSASNRVAVIVPPGRYDLGATGLTMDTPYIDLIGQTTDRGLQYLVGTPDWDNGVIKQTADYVRIENLTLENRNGGYGSFDSSCPAGYFPTVSGHNTAMRNCEFPGNAPTRACCEYAGYYENCAGGECVFGGEWGVASGIFKGCRGGGESFAGVGTASGTFIDCQGGGCSFGGDPCFSVGNANGTFINCQGGDYSFGGVGTANGTFINCSAGNESFGSYGGASGTFKNCEAGDASFGNSYGWAGIANGIFTDCRGGECSFGGSEAAGTFVNCSAGSYSFGPVENGGSLSTNAVVVGCSAGEGSFGSFNMAAQNFNYNTSGHIFAGGPIVGDGSELRILPQGDLSMGSYTNGLPQ